MPELARVCSVIFSLVLHGGSLLPFAGLVLLESL